MLHVLDAIILGALEGFTEFLPISSTAHLLIVSEVFHLGGSALHKTFVVAIQLGAIAAIVFYYRKQIPALMRLWKLVLLAFIPAAVIGYIFYAAIKGVLFEGFLIMAIALIVGGVVMIVVDKKVQHRESDLEPVRTLQGMKLHHAFTIGLFQALAVIPGVSRSAATIISGRLLGYSREAVTLFSFVLGSVTLAAAVAYDLYTSGIAFTSETTPLLLIGFFVAFFAAYASIGFMTRLVSRIGFAPFGWYRIALGTFLILFLFV